MTKMISLLLIFLTSPLCASLPDTILKKTVNQMGYMALTFDEITLKFLDFVGETKGTYVDAGAAFGSATRAALEKGAQKMIAIDLDSGHIEALRKSIPSKDIRRIEGITGDFPDALHIKPQSLDGILMARLLHFFDGPKIEHTLQKVYEWLKPGGKAFIITVSPHIHELKAVHPLIEKRFDRGEKWPGYFDNIWPLAPAFKTVTPQKFNVLTPEVIERALHEAGFKILFGRLSGFTPWAKQAAPDGSEILGYVVER